MIASTAMTTPSELVLYHGTRHWDGPPTVHPSKRGRAEHGPGIYLTTAYATARKYSNGGGVVLRVRVDGALTWLEDATVPLVEAVTLARTLRGNAVARGRIIDDLNRAAARMALRLGGATLPANTLVNLAVNTDFLTGDNGPRIAAWLTAHGIDASLVNAAHNEDWVVVFNPAKVLGATRVPPDVRVADYDLPRVHAR